MNELQIGELIHQRLQMLAALEAMLGKAYKQNWNDSYPKLLAQAEAAVAAVKSKEAPADFPPLTETGTTDQGGMNHTAAIKKLLTPTGDLYTSVSKGGCYQRLGAIRGAGTFKGLSGIAYRDDDGALFIREPECFAKRMVLIKPEGGAQ